MNFQLKGLRAEPWWKSAALAVLVVVLVAAFYSNVLAPSGDAPPAQVRTAIEAPNSGLAAGTLRPPEPEARPRAPLKPGSQTLRPAFKLGLREKQLDPASIDPTLRLDLLAKVQAVGMAGGSRNLFQFGAAPVPKLPEPKILPRGPSAQAAAGATGPAAPPTPAPKPPPPPIPLKFYGYAAPAPSGAKRVFFLDGDEIVVATEGQLVKNRYKVVRVGINSVVVEDVQFQHEQTLPLEEQAG
jgi:hypothetical protein